MTATTTTSTTTTTMIGYARTSTVDQKAGLEAQTRDLANAGCAKVFSEHASGVDAGRPELARALDYVRAGDVFVVTKPDRLARSTADLMNIVKALQTKGVELRILSMNLDTTTPTGKLMLGVLASVAEFEREIMLERQREGIAKAKAAGKFKGRQPTARAKSADVVSLYGAGTTPADIARQLEIGKASVYRILGEKGLVGGGTGKREEAA
jgi:DNA invertase Pin-like site-specific DNA recombinase